MAETIKPILSVEGFNNQFLNAMRQEALMEDGKLIVHYSKDGQPEAVSVRFTESSVSSVAYLDSLYELYHWEKMNVDTLVREVMRNVRAMKPLEFTNNIISKNNAPTHLKAAIINYEDNKTYLGKVPHERYFDMAICMDWDFGDGHLIHIHDSTFPELHMTAEQALAMAKENSFREIQPIKPMREGEDYFFGQGQPDKESDFYILTTKDVVNGSIAIADINNLSRIRVQLGEDFYILPTSIYESIVIPKSKVKDTNDLDRMMQNVKRIHEGTEEHLSNHVFIYQNGCLQIKSETQQNLIGSQKLSEFAKTNRPNRDLQVLADSVPAYQQRNSKKYREINSQENRMKEITDKLEKGIKEVFTSDKYREYLSTMNKFHSYSFNNSMLIHMQKPEASYVAGIKTWNTMERRVRKGEKGITIFAPCPYKAKKEVEVLDPKTGQVKRDLQGKPMTEEKEVTYASFKAISIFDISQTEGKPLPELAEELKGEIPDYMILMDSIKEIAPVPIKFESWSESKKGHYDLENKEIAIKSGMSELQTIKTAIHETAHSVLHKDKEHIKDSATMEVEAESVAFVVCQHLGLDTSDYSFGYLAGWSSGKELPELKSSLQTIQKTAHELIEDLDRAILNNTNNIDISLTVADEPMKISSIGDTKSFCHHRR